MHIDSDEAWIWCGCGASGPNVGIESTQELTTQRAANAWNKPEREIAKLRKQLAKARFRIRRTRGFCHAGSIALRAYKIARQQPTACNLRGLYRYYAELSGYQLEGLAKLDAIQRAISQAQCHKLGGVWISDSRKTVCEYPPSVKCAAEKEAGK